MYIRIKRDGLTVFLSVEPSERIDRLKDRVFSLLRWEHTQSGVARNDDKPVVGTVACDGDKTVNSGDDFELLLCRHVPRKPDAEPSPSQSPSPSGTLSSGSCVQLGTNEKATLAESKVENDDVLCIQLSGESPDELFARTMLGDEDD